jgi:3-oxoacyl-[acyl-carrier protein] reductase
MDKSTMLSGKTVVVTGGSSGIGASCARTFAAHGARIVIGYHSGKDRAAELCAELPGGGHLPFAIPLGDASAHADLATMLADKFGRVDVLVNSAGFTQRIAHADLATLTPEVFNQILLANAGGTYSVTRSLLPLLQASGDGLVVNISSVSASTGSGSNIAYCASKAAVETMTLSLARVFGPAVRFVCVAPASVDTGFVAGRSPDELARKALQTPLGRVVKAEDVALAVLACATHLRTATGTTIVIDGGHRL